MKLKDKIHNENRAEPPALPCCVVRPSSSSSTSSFGPPRRCSALVVDVRPLSSLFGPCRRHSALPLGPLPHPWAFLRHGGALRIVVGLFALLFGPSASLLGARVVVRALRIVVGPFALSFGPSASLLGRSRYHSGLYAVT